MKSFAFISPFLLLLISVATLKSIAAFFDPEALKLWRTVTGCFKFRPYMIYNTEMSKKSFRNENTAISHAELVSGRATIYFRYDLWASDGSTSDGRLCDRDTSTRLCDYQFKLRLGENGRFGVFDSLVWNNAPNSFSDFTSIMPRELEFPVADVPIPSELTVRLEVHDKNHLSDVLISQFSTKVVTTPVLFGDAAASNWSSYTRRDGKKRLSFSIKVVCSNNYYGADCNTYCEPRDDRYGHYTCTRTGDQICLPGYLPPQCANLNPCLLNTTCLNGGTCQEAGSSYTCSCRRGYSGRQCEIRSPCEELQCRNGASCLLSNDQQSARCSCTAGWAGPNCNLLQTLPCIPAEATLCRNNATCSREYQSDSGNYSAPKCTCPYGFLPPQCEQRHPCTQADTCNGLGLCVPLQDSLLFRCECIAGFQGPRCESSTRQTCGVGSCLNGGTCELDKCHCAPGFNGTACQFQLARACNSRCPEGTRCWQLLLHSNGVYGEPQCTSEVSAVKSVGGGKEEGVASVWVFLFVGAAGLLVLLLALLTLYFARKHSKMRAASRYDASRVHILSRSNSEYQPAVMSNMENFYEDEAQVEILGRNERADSIYEEPQSNATEYGTLEDQPSTVPKRESTETQIVALSDADYSTPSSAAVNVPLVRNNDVNITRPLPALPSNADLPKKQGAAAEPEEQRAVNVYSESPAASRRPLVSEAAQAQRLSNVYNVPTSNMPVASVRPE